MKKHVMATLLSGFALLISACGKSGGGSSNNGLANNTVNVCPAGAVNTQYGCLNQAGCPAGQGNLNGQCVPAINGTSQQCQAGYVFSVQYGCLQQGQCPVGYGLYQNQCVVANSNGGYAGQYPPGYGYGNGYYQGGYYQQYPNYGWGYPNYGYGYGYQFCYWFFGQMVCK